MAAKAYTMDVTIKHYHRGNLAGKLAMFFESDKAKAICANIRKDNLNCIAMELTDTNADKAAQLCERHRLYYEIIELR